MDNSNLSKKFWRKEIKRRIVLSLGNQCCICHNSFPDSVYDVHHINPEEKDFAISSIGMNGARTWLKIRDELKKCCLLCANCHRLVHNENYIINDNIYFNTNYYEWELTGAPMVNHKTLVFNTGVCECGAKKSHAAKHCMVCSKIEQRIIDRPSKEELKELIRVVPFTQIGRQFNVSDNTIRKWCISYNLPSKVKEIKNYSDEEWFLI